MVDRDLVRTKLSYIATNLVLLDSKAALSQTEFLGSTDQQYVVLHAMQLAIQAAIDVAAHIVTDEGWGIPARSGQAFLTLSEQHVLTADLAARLRTMAAFRNLVVHEYGGLDLNIVYDLLTKSLSDLRDFAAAVEAFLSGPADETSNNNMTNL